MSSKKSSSPTTNDEKQTQRHCAEGLELMQSGQYAEAIEEYEKATESAPEAPEPRFLLGFAYTMRGCEEEAIACYKPFLQMDDVYPPALTNLGLLYEDRAQYGEATKCYRRALAADPTNERARLYLKDVEGALSQFYDEGDRKDKDRQNEILLIPVADFELSVRSRNCLSKMNIVTVGDLIKKTETDLLSFKNFGETSLTEIKSMLGQLELRLGQSEEEIAQQELAPPEEEPPYSEELLTHSIDELGLSARSRKCMDRLGIRTIGDLVDRTEEELLNSRNFGRTSLNELKQRLEERGLSLREPEGLEGAGDTEEKREGPLATEEDYVYEEEDLDQHDDEDDLDGDDD